MTLREAEDVAGDLRRRAAWKPPAAGKELLQQAAEAIEWLLRELADAETYTDWLEYKD